MPEWDIVKFNTWFSSALSSLGWLSCTHLGSILIIFSHIARDGLASSDINRAAKLLKMTRDLKGRKHEKIAMK